MKGRNTFALARTAVNGLFVISVVATAVVFFTMTYRQLIRVEDVSALPGAALHVKMGSTEPTPLDLAYYLRDDVVMVQRVDRFDVYAKAHTALSYYCYITNVLMLAAFFCGALTLRRIFNTVSPGHNARRIRLIGWLFIGTDLLKVAGYYMYIALARQYTTLASTQLDAAFGKGFLAGVVILAISLTCSYSKAEGKRAPKMLS